MANLVPLLLSQLLSQAPIYLAYLVCIVVALINLNRYPRPAWFALIATVLLLATAIIQPFLHLYVFQARNDWGLDAQNLATINSIVGLLASIVRAGAFGLLMAAVFSGRKREQFTDSYQANPANSPNPFAPKNY